MYELDRTGTQSTMSPLLAEEGCRFPSIHALHAANMEPVKTRFGSSVDGGWIHTTRRRRAFD